MFPQSSPQLKTLRNVLYVSDTEEECLPAQKNTQKSLSDG